MSRRDFISYATPQACRARRYWSRFCGSENTLKDWLPAHYREVRMSFELPFGLKLHDFGDRQTVLPYIDDGVMTTRSYAVLESYVSDGRAMVLPFTFDRAFAGRYRELTFETAARMAAELFPTRATEIKQGDKFPPPIHMEI